MLNVVVITADDLSYLALGLSGIEYPKATNFVDSFASKGYCFTHAHSNISICEASRGVLMTGLYPQNNGCLSLDPMKAGVETLPNVLKRHGYATCLLGKEGHYRPANVYNWDRVVRGQRLGHGRNAQMYVDQIKDFLKRFQGQPFFIHANSCEPHRPYEGSIYDSKQVKLPDFLPNNRPILDDLCKYFTSVHRFDLMAKAFVNAVLESTTEPTLFVITSDHGMSFPYCKGNCYNFSNSVPMIFVGPDIKHRFDTDNLVAHVDFMPTILEYLGIDYGGVQDGISYAKLLKGDIEKFERDYIYMQFNKFIEPRSVFHCRSLLNNEFCYTYNISSQYPIWEVDGWGWGQVVGAMPSTHLNEFRNRQRRELLDVKLNRLSRRNVIDKHRETATKMHDMLAKVMSRYNDVVGITIEQKILVL